MTKDGWRDKTRTKLSPEYCAAKDPPCPSKTAKSEWLGRSILRYWVVAVVVLFVLELGVQLVVPSIVLAFLTWPSVSLVPPPHSSRLELVGDIVILALLLVVVLVVVLVFVAAVVDNAGGDGNDVFIVVDTTDAVDEGTAVFDANSVLVVVLDESAGVVPPFSVEPAAAPESAAPPTTDDDGGGLATAIRSSA